MIEPEPKITEGGVTDLNDPYQRLFNSALKTLKLLREAELNFEDEVYKAYLRTKPYSNASEPEE